MKIAKVVTAVLLFMIMLAVCPTVKVNAAEDISPSSIIKDGDSFLQDSSGSIVVFNENNQKDAIDKIYYTALTIGIVLAILIGGILGIQFITTGAAGQAKVKEKLVPFAIGAFIVFGAFSIWKIAYELLNDVMPG